MSRMTDEEINDIIERELPGYRMSRSKLDTGEQDAMPSVARAKSDASTPALEKVRAKYLGKREGKSRSARSTKSRRSRSAPRDEVNPDLVADDDVIVAVEPSDRDPLDRGARAKSVVVSAKEKRIIGRQG